MVVVGSWIYIHVYKGPASAGLGLSTFSEVFLQSGVGVTLEVRLHRFLVKV